jgi:hypothetical protein
MAQTARQSGLSVLAGQMPVRNQELADQQRAARTLQLQQAVAKLTPQQAPTTAQAAGLGATMAQQAGAEQASRAEQMVQATGQVAKLGQQEEALAGQQKIGALQEGARKEELNQLDRLSKLDASAKTELFDKELSFRKDAANQTFFSERQLADYKRQAATSDEQFKNWANQAQNYHKRNVATLEAMYNKLAEVERNNFAVGEQKLDQAAKKELLELKRDTERRLNRAKQRAANATAGWTAFGTIVGTGVGTLILPGAGTAVGASLGGSLGGLVGAQQAGQEEI